jgi:hypothetical protein
MLVVHSPNDNEVWDAVNRVTHNQVVQVYFNGTFGDEYMEWARSEPASPGEYVPQVGDAIGAKPKAPVIALIG